MSELSFQSGSPSREVSLLSLMTSTSMPLAFSRTFLTSLGMLVSSRLLRSSSMASSGPSSSCNRLLISLTSLLIDLNMRVKYLTHFASAKYNTANSMRQLRRQLAPQAALPPPLATFTHLAHHSLSNISNHKSHPEHSVLSLSDVAGSN